LPLCALAPTSSPPLRAQDMFALLARTQVLPGAAHRVSGAGASTLDAQEACACSRAGAEFRIAQGALQQGVLPPASYNASTSDVDGGALLQDARAGVFVGRHCGCRERSLLRARRPHFAALCKACIECDAGSGGHAVRGSVRRYLGVCACVVSIPVHFLTGSSGFARLAVAARGPDGSSFSSTCTASMLPPLPPLCP